MLTTTEPSAYDNSWAVPTPSGLLTWGKAAQGQLGHGRKQRHDVAAPTAVTPLSGRPVRAISCGHFHSGVVVGAGSSSEVLTCGRGSLGLLGHGDEEDVLLPRPVAALSGLAVRSIACGVYHTAAVTDRGELFCWGWKLERAAGGSLVEGYSTLPDRVQALAGLQVRHASCGHYCCAATTTDGALYTWGKGDHGQLGHGDVRDVVEPERVRGGALSGTFVWEAHFGRHFLLSLTAAGEVCSCGAADGGVLGRQPASGLLLLRRGAQPHAVGTVTGGAAAAAAPDEPTPRLVDGLRDVRVCAISCGEAHCAALGGEGEVYTWGQAAYGKLGHEDLSDVAAPKVVTAMYGKRLVEVACGAHMTLARDDGGHLWTWGSHSVHVAPPARLRLGGSACALAAGGGHCAVGVGDPVASASDMALAHEVGFAMPVSRAVLPEGATAELGALAALVDAPVPADADPSRVMKEVQELRGLLAFEEARREGVHSELQALQQQLQQVLMDEEMLRERRGGAEPPSNPAVGKGVTLVDKNTYHSMLPDEQVEVNLFGFKVGIAYTSKPT